MLKFIGIDLAWTYKNETGLCIIDETGLVHTIEAGCHDEAALVLWLSRYGTTSLSINVDAPCVVANQTGSRAVECDLMRYKINGKHLSVFASSRTYLEKTYGAIRGEVLRLAFSQHLNGFELGAFAKSGANVFTEVFPTGSFQGLFYELGKTPYKVKSKIKLEEADRGLARLIHLVSHLESKGLLSGAAAYFSDFQVGSGSQHHKHYEDMFDGFLCAFGAYAIYKGWASAAVFGTEETGVIGVPIVKAQSPLSEAIASFLRSEEEPKLEVLSVEAVERLNYLKSYQIRYRTKSGRSAVWELCSRGSLKRLQDEIFSGKSVSDGTVIFATNLEKTHVVVLKEYRVSAGRYVYMLPAGLSDANEDVFVTAQREFYEETGLTFEPVTAEPPRYVSVGIVNEKVTVVYGYYSGSPSTEHQTDEEEAEICFVDADLAKAILANEEVSVRTAMQLQQFFKLNPFLDESL